MKDEEVNALEGAEEWDFDNAERHAGLKNARAVVSVSFARSDFERVSDYAERANKRTSEFIREAALEKVAYRRNQEALAAFTASSGAELFAHTPFSTTRLSGSSAQLEQGAVSA